MRIVADRAIPYAQLYFSRIGDVRLLDAAAINHDAAENADILVVRTVTPVNKPLLSATPVAIVASASAGKDHIDTDFLAQREIGFVYAPGCNARAVAEYVISVLCVIAEIRQQPLARLSVGIIGHGHVGSRLAAMCAALGITTLSYDPPLQEQGTALKLRPLQEVLTADVVSLHIPLQRTGPYPTWHLVDEAFLKHLQRSVILVNTSRGGVVDDAALRRFATANPRAILALDVWNKEPDVDTALLALTRIATPHIAGYSIDGKHRATAMIYQGVCEQLGLQPGTDISPPLPAPPQAVISLSGRETADDAVRLAVLTSYDVRSDSVSLRQAMTGDPVTKAAIFTDLRGNYPLRREFPAHTVLLPAAAELIQKRLSGLGFHVQTAD